MSMFPTGIIQFLLKPRKSPVKMMNLSNQIKKLDYKTHLIRLLVWLGTTAGFVWQVTLVADQFFSYRVTTRLDISDAVTVRSPTLAVCFGTRWTTLSVLPVQAMFDQITPENETIKSLRYWNGGLSKYEDASTPETVYSFMNVTKFVKLQYICYSIDRLVNDHIDYYDLTDNFERPMFYRLHFHRLLKRNTTLSVDFNYFYMCSKGSHFYGPSTTFAQTAFQFNHVTLGYKKYAEKLLPPPYSTECFEYNSLGYDTKADCYELCLQGKFRPHKIHPFDVVTDAADDLTLKRFVPPDYPSNIFFMNNTKEYRAYCRHQCRHPDCIRNLYIPIVISINTGQEYLTLELYVSNEPVVQITAQPDLAFIDFATYIFSCIGFWFAWSPVALIPRRTEFPRKRLTTDKKRRLFWESKDTSSVTNNSRTTLKTRHNQCNNRPKATLGSHASRDIRSEYPRQTAAFCIEQYNKKPKSPKTRHHSRFDTEIYRSYWAMYATQPPHDKQCICLACSRNNRN